MICCQCPRNCGAERGEGRSGGVCAMGWAPVVARAALHFWEEPPISGTKGSGAVFFSGCSLRCVFCQNSVISQEGYGKAVSVERLREIFRRLVDQGAHNINLVTATHFAHAVIEALEESVPVPVVWNCGGYESVETLRQLEGKVQIYLPDLKYLDRDRAKRYSAAPDYPEVATAAIREMVRQTGPYQMEGERLRRGVMIRHLILPGQVENSLRVLDWIGETFPRGTVLVSLMRQYTPMPRVAGMPPLDRQVTQEEYEAVLSWMYLNKLEGFTQEAEAASEKYIPNFKKQ